MHQPFTLLCVFYRSISSVSVLFPEFEFLMARFWSLIGLHEPLKNGAIYAMKRIPKSSVEFQLISGFFFSLGNLIEQIYLFHLLIWD